MGVRAFFARDGRWRGQRALIYAAFGAALSWSFTTIAVAAKNVMSSVPDYVLIETGFTAVQWALVAPLTVFVLGDRGPTDALAHANHVAAISGERATPR